MESNNHEEVFIQSYSRLRNWAVQITQDQELAEDLLHDAFLQFTRTQPKLQNIQNTDAYLYGVIRNLHLSYIRKKTRRDKYALSIVDFETMRLGLRNINVVNNFQIQEELKRICYFLCLRKESSKSASVMILRFFHGYFPSEIAEVMRSNSKTVKVRLNSARNEAKSAIENSQIIQTIEKRISPDAVVKKSFRNHADLIIALGEMIFRSTNGTCLTELELKNIYLKINSDTLETKTLAHIVSCRKCIDKVNEMLNLLPISERYSVDFIGKNNGDSDNQSGNGGAMSNDLDEKVLVNWRRNSQEIYEHEPRELFFSINGDVKKSQKIGQNVTETKIEFNTDEPLEFIEIFSEQDVCLAFFSFTELKNVESVQNLTIELSENRKLKLSCRNFESSPIKLNVIYEHPNFEEIYLATKLENESESYEKFLKTAANSKTEIPLFSGFANDENKISLFEKIKNKIFPPFKGFKSAFAGGSLVILIISAILIAKLFVFVPNVSATEILQKAGNSEQLNENSTESNIYRVLDFEEKNTKGETVGKRKIEINHDAVRKLTVKRLFDENNRLIAGEWRRKDGVSTIYKTGKSSEIRLAQSDKELIGKDLDNIWQMSVSAKGFESLIENKENLNLEEENSNYKIIYSSTQVSGITKAVLVINQAMRAAKIILSVKQNENQREFHFTETVFEQKPRATVEKSVFDPNAEFIKQTDKTKTSKIETGKEENISPEVVETEATSSSSNTNAISPETEVKVLQLLNNVNALSGDQINILKTSDGKLQIKGIVDAKNRKDEIINALAELRGNPSVSINILTAEEASKNKSAKKGETTLESVSVESQNSIPASEILRNHFSAQGLSDEKIENEIRRFSSNALSKSSQVRRAALQMKQIAERFSVAELEKMDEPTRINWRKLIKQNASNLAQNSENLRNDLRSTLNIDTGNGGGNLNKSSDAELIKGAKRLFELSLSIDRDIRSSFSSSSGNNKNVPAKSAKFSNTLAEIIGLSKQF